jgi:hypothetical protein
MLKELLTISLLIGSSTCCIAQKRSDFETVEKYSTFLGQNFSHAFVGDPRPVISSDLGTSPHVNWWKILSDSASNNENGLPDSLSLSETQRMEVYRMLDSISRKSAEQGKIYLEKLALAEPGDAQRLSANNKALHANIDMPRLEAEERLQALAELFDKDQQRKLREIASARLQENVNLFVLINKLQLEEEIDLTAEEMKKFRDRLQEVKAEVDLELIRIRAKAWDDLLGALDRETREKLESKMLLNKVK